MTDPASKNEPEYVYAIVRNDLPSNAVKTVQVAHAVLAATHAYGDASRTHPHLVVCALPSEAALAELFERLKLRGVPVIAYYEDDLQNQLTALATGPLTGEARRPLRHLPLLPPGG